MLHTPAALRALTEHAALLLRERLRAAAEPTLAPLEEVTVSPQGEVRLGYAAVPLPGGIFSARKPPSLAGRAEQAARVVRAVRAAHACELVHGELSAEHLSVNASGDLQVVGMGAANLLSLTDHVPRPKPHDDHRALGLLVRQVLCWAARPPEDQVLPAGVGPALEALRSEDSAVRAGALDALERALHAASLEARGSFGLEFPPNILARDGVTLEELLAELALPLRAQMLPVHADTGLPAFALFTPRLRLFLVRSRPSRPTAHLKVMRITRETPDPRTQSQLVKVGVRFEEGRSADALIAHFTGSAGGPDLGAALRAWQGYVIGQFSLESEREQFEALYHQRVTVRVVARARDHTVTLRVLHAERWQGGAPLPEWREAWNDPDDITLRVRGRVVGRGVSWQGEDLRVLLAPGASLPDHGELELLDIGRSALLDRAARALQDLLEGRAANPDLARVLLDPASARSGPPIPAARLFQPLEPELPTRALIGRMLASQDLFALQGPPGTGKTTTITELILHEIARNPHVRILVTSQSRAAVSNVFERLEGVKRRGTELPRDFLCYRDDRTTRISPEFSAWTERVRQRSLEAGGEELSEWRARVGERSVEDAYARAANVYGATLMRLPQLLRRLDDVSAFDLVIIDEAARATLPELLVAMLRGKRVVLVGDHKQLPAHLESVTRDALRAHGFQTRDIERSLFEELFSGVPEAGRSALPPQLTHTLTTQYRMHPSIGRVVSEAYYDGRLATGTLSDRSLPDPELDSSPRALWWDLPGRPARVGTSWRNDAQVNATRTLLLNLGRHCRPAGQEPLRVAVICAYRAQVNATRRSLSGLELPGLEVAVDTVDAFQGQERDVIVYATGRPLTASSFVADPRRLNVAFSRAQRLLVVIGDRARSFEGDLARVARYFAPLPPAYTQETPYASRSHSRRERPGPRSVPAVERRGGSHVPDPASPTRSGGPARRRRRRQPG
ncbi:hypothetical protein HNR42_003594 [Deinobacterium chartae]|uniref:AAA+ ATPase domain-containing protein n=1 Tax=Deinobacterium chartae TaxID=521158 RepID=A0A841I6K4_9DEIO|nr:hypothetical protein [Deinobacterium chartae]